MGQQAATGLTTFNQFWQYFMPLFGAYVADQYWGRYSESFQAPASLGERASAQGA